MTNKSISNLQSPNPNTLWAETFVAELARCGLRAVCIAPGSRSTPLTLAFDAHPAIRVYLHLDERSAAFFALGMALAGDVPVALVCTSGTATANFHPAIIEAYMSQAPLLVLTADRPPELRHSGANQTVDQVKMYGDHVLWSVDVALPEAETPHIALRNLRTLAGRALAAANGLVKGPVHLNFPFRQPLEPEISHQWTVIGDQWTVTGDQWTVTGDQWTVTGDQNPATRFWRGVVTPAEEQLDWLTAVFNQHERGLIICGPRCRGGEFTRAVTRLSRMSGYPIVADPLSGLRFGQHVDNTFIIGSYDTFLAGDLPDWEMPQVIIRFGAVPISKSLNSYLNQITPEHRIHIRENGVWADDSHRTDHFLQANPAATCDLLAERIERRIGSDWEAQVWQTEMACCRALDEALMGDYFDGAVVADVVAGLPPDSRLFMGNSLPIRHLDQFGRPLPKPIHIFANRGASGIDGNISTGLGVGATGDAPLVLVLGDITFYHDLNGLLILRNLPQRRKGRGDDKVTSAPLRLNNVTIVLLNNNGGGIFNRLPISQFEPPFTDLFITPHGLDFELVVRMYGLDYVRANDRTAFQQAFAESVTDSTPRVIEVRGNGRFDHERRQEIIKIVNDEN